MTLNQEKKAFEKLELMGITNIADLLGWPKSKVGSYRKQGIRDFPEPIGEIGGRPVWTKNQIMKWRTNAGYQTGVFNKK